MWMWTAAVMLLVACEPESRMAQEVVDKAIAAHGFQHLEHHLVQFDFRGRTYSVERRADGYVYTRSFADSTGRVHDHLVNSTAFTRTINDTLVQVPDTMAVKYANSINSVLYFFQLPYLLNDPAVFKTYEGTGTIRGEAYHLVKVTFAPVGGGTDHDDVYLYWFHQETGLLDYLAYSYQTEGGGIRFREAYNRTERGGMIFQDYINYEVPKGTALAQIPALLEKGKLKELSRIENIDIVVKPMGVNP